MSRGTAEQQRSDEVASSGASHGPGPRLRDGRLARSMTLEEAAELLKLDPSVLAALERDDFTALPETLYVRGYLTSYARLLGIPETEVVRDYRAFSGETSAPRLSTRRPIQEHSTSGDVGIRRFSYGLMIGIVGLVGWWGYQRLSLEPTADSVPRAFMQAQPPPSTVAALEPRAVEPPAVEPTTQPPGPGPGPTVEPPAVEPTATATAEPLPPPGVETSRSPDAVEPESDLAEVAAYTVLPEPAEPAAASVDSAAAEERQADETVSPRRETDSVGSAFADPEPPPRAAAVAADAASEPARVEFAGMPQTSVATDTSEGGGRPVDQLQLSFSRDCWVEIRDFEEQRLVYGLAKAGSSRRVEGRAPFRILVGDSGAVEIRLNGEMTARSVYDAGDGRPARFTLGDEAFETAASP